MVQVVHVKRTTDPPVLRYPHCNANSRVQRLNMQHTALEILNQGRMIFFEKG